MSHHDGAVGDAVVGSWVLKTALPVEFKIKSSPGVFDPANDDLLEFGGRGPDARRFVVIDRSICEWYLDDVVRYFKAKRVEHRIVSIDATEQKKDLETLLFLLREMESFGLMRRNEPLIAVGGGVLLDIAGMAANLYRRGIPYIRVPTTLVGLVDASVGAKTAVNFEERRNRLGTYYPPVAAYLDKAFLRTLPSLEISSGLGEIFKMAVVKDARLFELLERHGAELLQKKFLDVGCADEVINRAVFGMKVELENNLWEMDLKRLVDFGHSFSPIIEMRSIHHEGHVPLTHGQAVSLDVMFSCLIANARGMLADHDVRRVFHTARAMELPTNHALFNEPLVILEALKDTMKHRNGAQNLPMPVKLGESVFLQDVSYDEIKAAARRMKEINVALFGDDTGRRAP